MEIYHFKVPEWVQHFKWCVCVWGGGGSTLLRCIQMLISIELYRTCDFPVVGRNGPDPLSPSGSALVGHTLDL